MHKIAIKNINQNLVYIIIKRIIILYNKLKILELFYHLILYLVSSLKQLKYNNILVILSYTIQMRLYQNYLMNHHYLKKVKMNKIYNQIYKHNRLMSKLNRLYSFSPQMNLIYHRISWSDSLITTFIKTLGLPQKNYMNGSLLLILIMPIATF